MLNLVIDLPYINPIALQLGPLAIHWYGIMYLLSFLLGYIFLRHEIRQGRFAISTDQLNDLLFSVCLALLIGARVGYILFYNFNQYWQSPATIFAVWQGGMSFHGGFIGATCGFHWFWRKHKNISFWSITDSVLTIIPFTLALGRLGNFINGELYGRLTTLPWAMKFWYIAGYRHPVQLYEALGHIIAGSYFVLTRKRPWSPGLRTALFVLYYSVLRFLVEFVREPDTQIGFILRYFTLGQLLTVPLFGLGIYLLTRAYLPKKANRID